MRFVMKKSSWRTLLSMLVLVALSACGMDGSQNTPAGPVDSYGNPVTTPAAGTTTASQPTMTIALGSNSISPRATTTLTTTVKDSYGAAVANAIVNLVADINGNSLGTLSPTTVLTDANGQATATLTGVTSGVTSLSATTQVGGAAVTSSVNYTVGSLSITLTPLQFGTSPLSANGSTSVTTDIYSNNAPLLNTPTVVTFNSTCVAIGKATIDTTVTSDGYGHTVASYVDKGCGITDVVTATVGAAMNNGSLTVLPQTAGSIQFISATPGSITLKGMGGQGHQESAVVIFKVVDSNNNPLAGKTVNFALTTSLGGIVLSQSSGPTDSTGQVSVSVQSGSISTPVRIIADTRGNGIDLYTQSDALTITTGIPDQDSASLSTTSLNIDGYNFDGTTTVFTMRLADHFNNPVPDGTVVNFTTEGGSITPSCSTVGGSCSATLTSSNPRPSNGRVTVLAYALGEESFTDLNGNGLADNAGEMIDANGGSTDLYEAFVDYNENGIRDGTSEPFFDLNGDGSFNAPDVKFSGVLCDHANNAFCSPYQNVHVRATGVVVFSSSFAQITPYGTSPIVMDPYDCLKSNSYPIIYRILGRNGQVMPAGSTIAVTSDNGVIQGTANFVVPSTNQNPPSTGTPVVGDNVFDYYVRVSTDSVVDIYGTGCKDTTPSGSLTVTVTTPLGKVSTNNLVTIKN